METDAENSSRILSLGQNSNKRKKGFDLQSTGLFLTYPQCSLSPSEALPLLKDIVETKGRSITEYVIATEKHADGNDHLHAYLKLDKKIHIKNEKFFDLGNHHGNYQGARSPTKVKKYCAKEGNFIADPPIVTKTQATPWKLAIATAKEGRISDAMKILEDGGERSCRDLILHSNAILTSFTSMKPISPLPNVLDLTKFGNLFDWDRHKQTLLLCGATNTGKTTLAASLIPLALFTRHLDLVANLRPEHKGIILDDMTFKHLHDEAQIALTDCAMETNVHVRYRVATIPAGLPRIITSNKEPYEIFNMNNPAIARRILCIRWLGWQSDPSWMHAL